MSSCYSANQYDGAFRSQRLQNWCETKRFKERPSAQEGHTTIIADDRGHLLPGVVKRGSTWPDFKGTWDLPARIPARHINPTGRSVEGLNRLRSWGFDPQHPAKSQAHRGSKITDRQQEAGKQTDGDVQQSSTAPSSAAEARPASQNRPVIGSQRITSQNPDSQAAVAGSAGKAAEEGTQAAGEERPLSLSQGSAAGQGTNRKPHTGNRRPASNVAEKGATSSSRQRHR